MPPAPSRLARPAGIAHIARHPVGAIRIARPVTIIGPAAVVAAVLYLIYMAYSISGGLLPYGHVTILSILDTTACVCWAAVLRERDKRDLHRLQAHLDNKAIEGFRHVYRLIDRRHEEMDLQEDAHWRHILSRQSILEAEEHFTMTRLAHRVTELEDRLAATLTPEQIREMVAEAWADGMAARPLNQHNVVSLASRR